MSLDSLRPQDKGGARERLPHPLAPPLTSAKAGAAIEVAITAAVSHVVPGFFCTDDVLSFTTISIPRALLNTTLNVLFITSPNKR